MRPRVTHQAPDQGPEPRAMVGLEQVSALVGDDIVRDRWRREHQAPR